MVKTMFVTAGLLAGLSTGAVARVQSGVQPLPSGVIPRQSGVAGANRQQQEMPPAPAMPQAMAPTGGDREGSGSSARPATSLPDARANQVR